MKKEKNNIILTFEKLSSKDVAIAGGKGASLGEMARVNIPVPQGFVILSNVFERFLEETDLNIEIESILDSVNHKEIHTIENASEKIKALILEAEMPKDIVEEIQKFFKKLDAKYIAVRSSATAEDSASAAWAGQLESYLNTTGESLLENVKKCWASLFTPRAIFYRFEKDLHNQKISVAVVVQKMIESEVSGIAFSVHPVTQDRNQLIIEAGFGLGEAIVSGQITPDSYVIEKNPRRVIDINVSTQERGLYRNPQGGNEWKQISEPKASSQVLDEKKILELTEIILTIENHYNFPCDVEWAYEDGKFYIVQSRPITTLQKERSESSVDGGLTKEILNTRWSHLGKWIEPALAAEVWLEYGSIAQQFFTQKLDKRILYLNGDFFLSQHDSDIFQAEGYEASKKHNKEFFQKIYNVVQAVTEEISNKIKTIVSVVSFLEDYKKLTGVWMSLNNIAAGIEKYVQEVNPKAFTMTKGFLNEKSATLQQIDEMNELKEKIEKTIGKKLDKPEEIPTEYSNLVKVHIKKYEWLGTHHFNIGQLTIENLVQRMQQAKAKTPQDSVKEDDTELTYLIWLLDLIGYVRFKAAETSGYTTYYLKSHLIALAKERGLAYEDIVEHTINEISSQNITKEIAEKRKDNTGFYFDGTEHILSIEQIKNCLDKLLKVEVQNDAELKGLSAQSGKVKGVVKIVIKQDQMKGFESGMVLVAHETTPDIIFAMQKSSAIVTDFGGLTSHAAIVARELKKPCIVGTKFATKILKDGDMVEVDADNGIVRILK